MGSNMLTSRERIIEAINHKPVDRNPVDLGSTPNTTISRIALKNLISFLDLDYESLKNEIKVISRSLQCVSVPEKILKKFDIDTRPVFRNPSPEETEWVSEDEYIDKWGIKWRAAKTGKGELLYYDMVEHPLEKASSVSDVESYNWPDGSFHSETLAGISERAKKLSEKGDYALVGHPGDTSLFETSWYLRGMQKFFSDLLKNKNIAHTILTRLLQIRKKQMEQYLGEIGNYLDIVSIGDDLGMQTAPLISPEIYREVIKPYHKEFIKHIKSLTSAKLHLHSDGAIEPFLSDLIEIGVDIVNPVQVSAEGMDPNDLRKEYGKKIVFWGGIDTQRVLPQGTEEEVKQEVLNRIDQFNGLNGGYVVSAVHNIQADVPPENICALFNYNHLKGDNQK